MSEIKTETISVTVPKRLPGPIQVGDWVRLRLPGEEPEGECVWQHGAKGNAMKCFLKSIGSSLKVHSFDDDGDARFLEKGFVSTYYIVRCEPNTRFDEAPVLPKPSPAEVEAALETLRRASL